MSERCIFKSFGKKRIKRKKEILFWWAGAGCSPACFLQIKFILDNSQASNAIQTTRYFFLVNDAAHGVWELFPNHEKKAWGGNMLLPVTFRAPGSFCCFLWKEGPRTGPKCFRLDNPKWLDHLRENKRSTAFLHSQGRLTNHRALVQNSYRVDMHFSKEMGKREPKRVSIISSWWGACAFHRTQPQLHIFFPS